MVNPVPGRGITTPYGKPGNWSGGRHGGADWAAPTGTTVVAAWSGTVTGASWGSSYGTQVVIDQDRLPNGSAGLWAVYAHLSRKSVSPGQRVTAGQKIGEVGSTGNATGPHLHYEVQRAANWRSGNHVNPQPWIDATPGGGGGGWRFPAGHKVYAKYLKVDGHGLNSDGNSDSIRALQEVLNKHSMPGGTNLPITGKYWTQTDTEVRLCQRLHLPPEDPAMKSFVGPKQWAHLAQATGCPYTYVP